MYLVVKLGTTAPPWVKVDKPKIATPVSQLDAGTENGQVNGTGNGASPA
jgi:hypothetical protein